MRSSDEGERFNAAAFPQTGNFLFYRTASRPRRDTFSPAPKFRNNISGPKLVRNACFMRHEGGQRSRAIVSDAEGAADVRWDPAARLFLTHKRHRAAGV